MTGARYPVKITIYGWSTSAADARARDAHRRLSPGDRL
jgi:hypothetical protein